MSQRRKAVPPTRKRSRSSPVGRKELIATDEKTEKQSAKERTALDNRFHRANGARAVQWLARLRLKPTSCSRAASSSCVAAGCEPTFLARNSIRHEPKTHVHQWRFRHRAVIHAVCAALRAAGTSANQRSSDRLTAHDLWRPRPFSSNSGERVFLCAHPKTRLICNRFFRSRPLVGRPVTSAPALCRQPGGESPPLDA